MRDFREYDSYAYFSIESELPLSDICAYMGVTGNEGSFGVGDRRTGNPDSSYRISSWKMRSGVPKGACLDEHLKGLWTRLEPLRHLILGLPPEMTKSVKCIGHFRSHHDPVRFSAGHFATAGYYGLKMDYDFYFDNEFGNENRSLPYWTWRP
jgi:hypothetical protein